MSVITLFAMIFSAASIVLTAFEFSIKKYLLDTESVIIVKFKVNSEEIQQMTRSEFIKKIENKRNKITTEVAKLLSVDFAILEQSKPIPCTEGLIYICEHTASLYIVYVH